MYKPHEFPFNGEDYLNSVQEKLHAIRHFLSGIVIGCMYDTDRNEVRTLVIDINNILSSINKQQNMLFRNEIEVRNKPVKKVLPAVGGNRKDA